MEYTWAIAAGLGATILVSLGVIAFGAMRIRDAREQIQAEGAPRPLRMNQYNAKLFGSGWRAVTVGALLFIVAACLFIWAVMSVA